MGELAFVFTEDSFRVDHPEREMGERRTCFANADVESERVIKDEDLTALFGVM